MRVESRAAEPILPLRLFRERTFAVVALIALSVGFALFGSVTYMPTFLQVVKGDSPTASGLQMVPMMGGTLFSSIVTGQLISRYGRYRIFPIVGTATATVGLYLLSGLRSDTSSTVQLIYLLILGLGLGLVNQVLIIAVQNAAAVPGSRRRDIWRDDVPADRWIARDRRAGDNFLLACGGDAGFDDGQ